MNDTAQPEATQVNQPTQSSTECDSSVVGEDLAVENSSLIADEAEPFLTVKYNKQTKGLSRDEAKTYAQKGMNYDKILGRLEEANAKLKGDNSLTDRKANSDNRQAVVNKQLSEFLQSNPGIDPVELPKSVLEAWKKGVPLSQANALYQANKYQSEINNLKNQILELKTNEQNSKASMGRPSSAGSTQQKPLTAEAIKKMSKKEIDKNIERIWEFLTGVKRKK